MKLNIGKKKKKKLVEKAEPFWLVEGKIDLWWKFLGKTISININDVPSRINFSLTKFAI